MGFCGFNGGGSLSGFWSVNGSVDIQSLKESVRESFRGEGRDGGEAWSTGGCVEGNCGFGNRSEYIEAFLFSVAKVCLFV